VDEAELARTLVVSGLSAADPATTEKAVWDAFSRYGELERIMFQDDAAGAEAPPCAVSTGAAAAGTSPARMQHAVLVFYRESAASAALAASGSVILGAPVSVTLAHNLVARTSPSAPGPTPTLSARTSRAAAVDAVSELLSHGYLYGVQGVAHLKRFDDERGVSRRILVATAAATTTAERLNQQYHVTQTLQSGYDRAAAQVAELDARYHIRERVSAAAAVAMATATTLAGKAMANPRVATAVNTTKSLLESAGRALDSYYYQARADVATAEAKLAAERGGGAAAAPGGGSGGGGGGAVGGAAAAASGGLPPAAPAVADARPAAATAPAAPAPAATGTL
jgi:hypothetical protein